jgi:hypothetical protein
MMVELKMKDGSTKTGYHNGKTYGDSVYITPAGFRSGIKVALADIESVGELVTEAVNKEETRTHAEHITARQRNNGLCPRCHTYCYGDCTA